MARVRVHQHVNPLSPYYKQEPSPIDLTKAFAMPTHPLHVDIGCGRGRFILRMAEAMPDWNFLGVEIREPLVIEANEIASEEGVTNLHYEFCNAMIWLECLLADIPHGLLKVVTIQFSDPWFKKKHAKRRMVNPAFAKAVTEKIDAGGQIFIQTDIAFLADEMFEMFRSNPELIEYPIKENPFQIKTEREIAVEKNNLPIYRVIFKKDAALILPA